MPTLKWNDRYSIGVPQIDEQHKYLFLLMRKTYDNFINKIHYNDLDYFLDELIDYATYHISTEEQCMIENSYPGLIKQKQEHDIFFARIVEMANDYHGGQKHLLLEILSFLHSWLSCHILQTDAEFGRFIAAKNRCVSAGVCAKKVSDGEQLGDVAWNR